MSQFSCVIVEICEANDKRAEALVDFNKDLGYRIYRYRGALLTILITEGVWRSPEIEQIAASDGLYVWREDKFEKV
jgi:hypothetical protein